MEEIQRWQQRIQNCRHGGPEPTNDPWFQQAVMFVQITTPLDVLIDIQWCGSNEPSDDNKLKPALVDTINIVVDNFNFALAEIRSKKVYASMGVDAWLDEDFKSVRKFLIRTIMIGTLQSHGATRIIKEINQEDEDAPGRTLLRRIKGVLQSHNAGLKHILKQCIDTSCICIELAQKLNEEKEVLSNPSVDRETILARRKERELPPILQSSSEYWNVKKKATNALKLKKLGESKKIYLQAMGILEDERNLGATANVPVHQIDWMNMIGEERGKICSNLSMICLRQNLKEEALDYADKVCSACPSWYKSFCRRALALMALGKYDEAQVAIYKAMSKETTEKERKECLKIQQEIKAELKNMSGSELDAPWNPLYNIKLLDSYRTNQVGTISAISDQDGIMDIVYSYLTPTDVAQLERTCKRYANVERTRRIAIGREQVSVDPTIEIAHAKYINNTRDSPTVALKKFLSEISPIISGYLPSFFMNMLCHKMDPMSLETLLAFVFSNSDAQLLYLLHGIDSLLSNSADFRIARFVLRGDNNVCRSAKYSLLQTILSNGFDIDGREDDFARMFFKYSLDLEVMKLALSINDDDDDNLELRDMAFTVLNNSILVKCMARRREMSQLGIKDPIYDHTTKFHSIYTEQFPDDFPGLVDWERGLFDKESIKQSWVDDPGILQMWRAAFYKALKWVQHLEKAGVVSDYLILSRIIQGEDVSRHPNSPINFYSFGPFLIMKSVEHGGAVSMSVRLEEEDVMINIFYDYYSFLKLYRIGFPAIVDYSQRVLASHHSYMG